MRLIRRGRLRLATWLTVGAVGALAITGAGLATASPHPAEMMGYPGIANPAVVNANGEPPMCPTIGVNVGRSILVGLAAGSSEGAVLAGTGASVVGRIPALGIVVIQVRDSAIVPATVRTLVTSTPGVLWAEQDHRVRASTTTNDPLLSRQWALRTMGMTKAWDKETGTTTPVTVAVLDTGIDASHPDLAGRVLPGYDAINGYGPGRDDSWHGTAVAGIIGAESNNAVGMAGISWGARLLPVKVLDADGSGDDCSVAAGMALAVRSGARVLNLSFGEGETSTCPLAYAAGVRLATAFNALVVAAAGNDAQHGNPVEYPASCAGVLSVGATDERDRIAPFSERNSAVDLTAPGVLVVSTYRDPRTGQPGYAYVSGTSFAAPMVSGVAALLMSAHPGWPAARIADQLLRTSHHLGLPGQGIAYGVGRLDAARALS